MSQAPVVSEATDTKHVKAMIEAVGHAGRVGVYHATDASGDLTIHGPTANALLTELLDRRTATPQSGGMVVKRLADALQGLIDHVTINECRHEETHRGGMIWTICDHCGRKWADDQGGFVHYEEPPALTAAYAAIRSTLADPIPEAPADEEVEGLAQALRNLAEGAEQEDRTILYKAAAALRRSTATDKPGVREAALEEAAKVAETITQDGDYDLEPEATVAASVAGKQIAAAIRSLRTSPPASPTEAGEATTSLPDPALTDAIEWLETNQRQLDQDGIEVAVSRQALEQVLAALKDRSHV